MSRVHRFKPDELNDAQRKIYNEITTGKRTTHNQAFSLVDDEGRLEGPFNAMLLQPAIGNALQQLGGAVRYKGLLSDRARELAILIVAAHWQSSFERYAHERVGAIIGLTEAEMQAIRDNEALSLDDKEEQAVVWATRHLLEHGNLSDAEFDNLIKDLSPEKIFELTTLIGLYSMIAMQMHVFGITVDEDSPNP